MITLNRIRLGARRALLRWQARRAIARANRLLAKARGTPNPGYDELSNPVFLGVMALAIAVLLVDIPDAWPRVTSFILALGEWARSGA